MKRSERYEILETIQQGALATSYRARDRVLDRPVLLKVLHPHLNADPELVQRFRREAQLQARLKHPNIVTVYDFGAEDDFYIASEFIEGETLEDVIRRRRLAPAELAPIIIQVVRALRFAHEHGVIHRDLKPANIMISSRGDAKLADFGLACARDYGGLTQEGCVIGTPAYMSPEQARGRPTDARTDIFSLGIVIYQALTGANPFAADNHADAMSRVLSRDVPRLDRKLTGLPPGLVDVVARMLTKDRDQRLDSLEEVARAFATLAPTPVGTGGSRRRLGLILTGLGGAAVVTTVLLLVVRPGSRPSAAAGLADTSLVDSVIARPESALAAAVATVSTESEPTPLPQADQPVMPPRLCRLELVVKPWAEVLIDSRLVGVTPLTEDILLPTGRHEITLRNPYFPEVTKTVELTDTVAELVLDLDLAFARVEFRVVPWAVLSIDGVVVDTTPTIRPVMLPLGTHVIELYHPELGRRVDTVLTDSARGYRLTYDLSGN